ncbi:NAC domain containing protein 50-like [Salvia miltiorrhiza]|uniref:NAC domain containing protein 50-like n=1 Tax=Salvia miltiorrhiza TaxID=226208 RepID=UPI0025AB6FB3|nr:NAC domain containing protein 50-like [Salvia miltiorrhiza]
MEMGQEVVVAAVGSSAAPSPRMGAPPPTSLAPGFRFHPTDEELVRYYLRRKVCGKPFRFQAVTEIDVYKSEPWELAEYSSLKTRDLEWYFFSPVDRKYGNGSRLNRATGKGYWKATGKDRSVRHKNQSIGMKKTLVFHSGRAPDGKRTNWVMHEYRLCDSELETAGILQDAFVLCRIFQKSGLGPPNGDRYAPFIEEEWDEDAPLVIPGGDVEDDVANGDEVRGECMDLDQDTQPLSIAPPLVKYPVESTCIPFLCKRERAAVDPEPLSLDHSKRSKHDDPNSSNANGSEDSTTTSQDPSSMMMMTKINSSPLEFPLLETLGSKDNLPANAPTFDSANLEKSVPPGYLKFISNLENEILNISMEKETLKIEVMRAQAMINILQSRVESLTKENEDCRRRA